MALGLAIVVIGIGISVVRVPSVWLSPGVMILPILIGGLLLWPRALWILFGIVAVMVAYDWLNGKKAGFGIIATIVVTGAFAAVSARTRAKLGMQGMAAPAHHEAAPAGHEAAAEGHAAHEAPAHEVPAHGGGH